MGVIEDSNQQKPRDMMGKLLLVGNIIQIPIDPEEWVITEIDDFLMLTIYPVTGPQTGLRYRPAETRFIRDSV